MTAQEIAPRRATKRTPRQSSIRPWPKPPAKVKPHPQVYGAAMLELISVEDDLTDASTEAVYQRDDLAEAASPENNRLMRRAIRALDNGDPVLARELMVAALFIEEHEDAAARRAEQRRERMHGHQKNAMARTDSLVTGTPYELAFPLNGVMAPGICGAER